MIIKQHLLNKIGSILFLTGVFLLPSMFFFAAIFLFLSGLIGSLINKNPYFYDKHNLAFFICGLLILISITTHLYGFNNAFSESLDSNLSIVGSLNWLPFFWLFWGFQPYLNSIKKRKKTALFLVSGTFPILVSGFGQYFFDWTGPLETLNGLIIWYQRPMGTNGLTGPFNNQNYAGAWLSLVWPFTIAFVTEKTKSKLKKGSSILFCAGIGFAAILTHSRNAWVSIFLALPLIFGTSSFNWIIPISFLVSTIIAITTLDILKGGLQEFLRLIIPEKIWMEFINKASLSRLDIFLNSLQISLINPFFGLGAASFPVIYELQNNIWRAHTHNLILELAISYGYPVATIFFLTVGIILISSGKIIFGKYLKNSLNIEFEKAWWVSIFVFLISQTFDVQYFDGRISIVFWLLLSGLKTIIDNNEKLTYEI